MDKRKLLRGLLWDVGLPAVVYYGGRALGYDVLRPWPRAVSRP